MCGSGYYLLLLVLVTLLASESYSCPEPYCLCTRWPNIVNCSSLPNLEQLNQDFPADTNILQIRHGKFYKVDYEGFKYAPTQNLRTLEITTSQLQEISDKAFITLPTLQELKLSRNQIEIIWIQAFFSLASLHTLDLSHNSLQSFSSPNILQPLGSLKYLDLSNNRINFFPDNFFTQQTRLMELHIANNYFDSLRGSNFIGLRDLRKFLASSCRIRSMDNEFFAAITNVDTLDLSYNQITSLPNAASFSSLKNLRNFTLTGNKILALADEQFPGLNLNTLDLSGNNINSVSANTFKYLVGLRNLDLSSNHISSLPSYIFQPISSALNSLGLQNNRELQTLPNQIFYEMEKLNHLNLSSCSLRSLSDDHFRHLRSLQQVDMSGNQLESVPQALFDRIMMNGMMYVKLDNNQWQCDCHIKPLRNWLQLSQTASQMYCEHKASNGVRLACPALRCSSPVNMAGRDIALLRDSDLADCENVGSLTSPETSVILGAVLGAIGAIILIIIIVVIVICLYRRRKRGQPLLCGTHKEYSQPSRQRNMNQNKNKKHRQKTTAVKRNSKKDKYYSEKKERRNKDPEIGSLNESDKSFVVRNYFHSMNTDEDEASEGTQSMARKGSIDSLSQSGYGYGSRHGSRHSSQYSLHEPIKIESAV